jgi:hypothetical protein
VQARSGGSTVLRTRSRSSVFVQGLLANGELSQVRSDEVCRDDIVLYFADNELKHAGRVASAYPI